MILPQGTNLQSGKYKIKSVLGQGGFGITYLATNRILVNGSIGQIEGEITVAVKEFFMKDCCFRDNTSSQVISKDKDKDEVIGVFKHKFLKEATSLSKLHHKNIVKVLDVFSENGTVYYVMEHVQGISLDKYIKQQLFEEDEAIRIIGEIGDALAYLHDNMINHLDVKPANIILRNDRVPILIDFGISRHFDATGKPTTYSPTAATRGYAPPEQELGQIDRFWPVADVYSLGATLFNMVTGIQPPASFNMGKGVEIYLEKCKSSQLRHLLPYAMQPMPEKRPQSIREFLKILNVKTSELEDEKHPFVINTNSVEESEKTHVITSDKSGYTKAEFDKELASLLEKKKNKEAYLLCNDVMSSGMMKDYAISRRNEIEKIIKTKSKLRNRILTVFLLLFIVSLLILIISGVSELLNF